ncbi:MAG: RNA polymerase factor sigma-54 [Bacteroidetes bacterium]|nr:RNA polymerase factor sigma-54 [Bacteroidota bacterium]
MQKQRLQQNQQLKLSPQQIQFLSLLQIPVISLEKRIEEELEDNPALEETSTEEPDVEEWEGYGPSYRQQQVEESTKPTLAEREETLQEFLLKQLPLHNLNESEFQLAEFLIGCLDDNGFLTRELYAIADDLLFKQNIEITEQDLAPILSAVQSLDPAGVGARNLQECLLLQLQRKTATEAILLATKILQQQYQAFSTKNFEKLQRELTVSEEALKSAFDEISKLNPKPGGSFLSTQEGVAYITPDFILNTVSGTLNLQLNNKRNFRVGPSKQYQKMLSELKQREDDEAIQFLKKKLESAQWFADALKQRENTLLNTMNCIMELQSDFFKSGDIKDLKPMKLMDVAQKVKRDISTISRVTNSKYIETPFGTFLLKEFFSEAYSKEDGTTISTKVIKSHLHDILEKENRRQPYTDEQLSELLDKIGYHIARRTVAKYREQLGFSVARLRKEL